MCSSGSGNLSSTRIQPFSFSSCSRSFRRLFTISRELPGNPSLYIVRFCNSCLYCSNLSFILLTISLTSLGSEKPNHKSFFPVRLPFSAAVIIFYQYALPITQAIIIILASLTCSIFHLTSYFSFIKDVTIRSLFFHPCYRFALYIFVTVNCAASP